ncbi:MAG: hypothetical protein LBQ94_01750 [Treponema sp.]|jgi:ppGpp synthetase/RelA/SpoT-type nucleotidyltranferase|nr:hypothetical protein [Treponema sp.]
MERIELQRLINEHTSFTTKLFELIESLLTTSNIKYHTIEHRTKTIESLEEKIVRKSIRDIKEEIMDISGIRIILYYQDDVDKVVDLIKDNFIIDEQNSINKADLHNSNEFGYLSVHYIVTLDSKRNNLLEWRNYSDLKAEIQIRTVLQHSWASISHELTYKKNYEIPRKLERKLYRLAGLFELADEQFLNIKEEHNLLKEQIKNESTKEEAKNIEINLLTLKYSFEKESSISNTIEKFALEAGFESLQRKDDERFSNIAFLANMLGYRFINEIERDLQSKIEDLKLYFNELIKLRFDSSSSSWFGDKSFFFTLAMLFFLNNEQLNEFQEKSKWNTSIFNRVRKAIYNIRNNE